MRADWDVSSESADEAELRRAEQAEAGERFMEVMIQGYADMKIDAKLLLRGLPLGCKGRCSW